MTGLVVFIAAVNGAVDNKLTLNKSKEEEAPFIYKYGFSFFSCVLSFLMQEFNGIFNIIWYIDYFRKYRYLKKETSNQTSNNQPLKHDTVKYKSLHNFKKNFNCKRRIKVKSNQAPNEENVINKNSIVKEKEKNCENMAFIVDHVTKYELIDNESSIEKTGDLVENDIVKTLPVVKNNIEIKETFDNNKNTKLIEISKRKSLKLNQKKTKYSYSLDTPTLDIRDDNFELNEEISNKIYYCKFGNYHFDNDYQTGNIQNTIKDASEAVEYFFNKPLISSNHIYDTINVSFDGNSMDYLPVTKYIIENDPHFIRNFSEDKNYINVGKKNLKRTTSV